MELIKYSLGDKTEKLGNCAVALGFFDGVHIGHRRLIAMLTDEARRTGLTPCIFTFTENLKKSGKKQTLIYNTEDKIKILSSLGVERIILADFGSLCGLTAEQFVRDVLIGSFGAELAICGYNFRFGAGASSGAAELASLMASYGRRAAVLDEQRYGGEPVSATRIRALLSEGMAEEAAELMSMPYFIRGRVERGLGLGSTYGFPTVNMEMRGDSPLRSGVYRTAVTIGGRHYTGITNIGSCPTVGERELHAETLIADFEGDLYGEEITVYFLGYLREERKFSSIDELKKQIYADKERAIKENGDSKWQETGLS